MDELRGRAALVTGGSRGIGAATATALARRGADVAITYLQDKRAAAAVEKSITGAARRALVMRADSGDPADVVGAVHRTADQFGRLDILVNNAGIFPVGPMQDISVDDARHTLDVHVLGVFLASQAAATRMADGGRIICIGSCFAERVPYPGVTLYAMSKAALGGLVRGLARDLGDRQITANVIHPGSTDTDMNPADGPGADAERRFIALGRYAVAEEIAATVLHLAGDGGRYITGASLAVDGGFAA